MFEETVILYMYAAIVGLNVGQAMAKNGEDIIISFIGMCGYACIIMFNNPGQGQLEELMHITCTICTMIFLAISYIVLHNENEDFSNQPKEKENGQSRKHVHYSISPQNVEEILHRLKRQESSIGDTKGTSVPKA